jgi:anti-sigma B factor antagonist
MEVRVREAGKITVVELAGELTWSTAPVAQARIVEQLHPGSRIVVDMSGVSFMASAGLRMLLVVYRTVGGTGGRVILAGASEEIRETMEVTGFLDFFTLCGSLESAIAELGG